MQDIQQQIFSELDKFQKLTDDARKIILEVADKLNDGYSPEESTTGNLFASLKGLRKLYESICSMIASESNALEVSHKELSASELRKIAQGINEAAELAKEDLRRFIRIKSSMEMFSDQIKPVQEKAEKLLQRLEQNPTGSARKSALNEAVKYQKFLAMLDQELTEGNVSNTFELSKIFPAMTVIGLTANQYHIDGEDSRAKHKPENIPIKTESTPQNVTRKNESTPQNSTRKTESTPQKLTRKNESTTQKFDDSPKIPAEDRTLTPRNPVKPKKPSAKAFRDEIIKTAVSAGHDIGHNVMELINIFSHYAVLTVEQAFEFRVYYMAQGVKGSKERREYINEKLNDEREEGLKATRDALEWLERKKAVSYFPVDDEEGFYCLTQWLADTLEKAEVKKRFKEPSIGKALVGADNELSEYYASKAVQRNSMMLEYLLFCNESDRIDKLGAILNGTMSTLYDTTAPVFWDGKEYKCEVFLSLASAVSYTSVTKHESFVVAQDSPDQVNSVLESLDDETRDKVFILDDKLYRGFVVIDDEEDEIFLIHVDDDDDSADLPAEDLRGGHESQLGFNFDSDNETTPPDSHEESKNVNADSEIADESEMIPAAVNEESENLQPEESTDDSESIPAIPDDDTLAGKIISLLNDTDTGSKEIPYPSLITAVLAAKAAESNPDSVRCSELSAKIDMAAHVLRDSPEYTGANLSSAFPDSPAGDEVSECLMLAAYLRAMISPEMPYSDFEMKRRLDEISADYDSFFPSAREARKVFARIYEFHKRFGTFPADFLEKSGETKSESGLSRIRTEAESLLAIPTFNKDMKVLPFFAREFFGPACDIYPRVKAVSDDDRSMIDDVRAFVERYYDPNEKMSAGKMEDLIDKVWADVWHERAGAMQGRVRPLISNLRTSVERNFYVRLSIMHKWLSAVETETVNFDAEALTAARNDILSLSEDALSKLRGKPGKCIVMMALDDIRAKLTNSPQPEYFAVLLTNGIIPLDSEGSPILGNSDVKYYEPVRNMMRFINAKRLTLSQAEQKILYDEKSPMYENLHQLEMIYRITGRESDLGDDAKRARESAEKYTEDFRLKIDTDYAFGRISEDDAETLKSFIAENESIMAGGDFGCWRQFLEAIRLQADDISAVSKERILSEIKSCIESAGESPEILSEAMRLAEEGSLNAAESFLNRYESAKAMGIPAPEVHSERTEIDAFTEFMTKFDELYRECDKPKSKEKTLKSLGKNYIEDNPPEEWPTLSRKLKDERTAIIDNWPSRLGNTTHEQIRALVAGLGFSPETSEGSVKKESANPDFPNVEIFSVMMRKNDGRNCSHPIAKFGTKLESLSVIILYGSGNPEKIVSSIMEREPGTSILLMDYHISKNVRSQFAKSFRTHGRQDKYFLLVDRVLALFLTLKDTSGRLSTLLQCTLPYTSCIPFTKGSGYVAPEMFYGRERELADIRSPEGSSIVYGGRQLGKTSLLRRAETLEHNPDKLKFAVYSDLTANGLTKAFEDGFSEPDFVSGIIHSVNAKVPGLLDESNTLQAMCGNIEALISGKKAASFMLLLDEADAFLDSIRGENYEPLLPLVNLRKSTEHKFRFVLAGLHNVMRAKKYAADNNPLGQLGYALCIRPLSPFEAQRLLLEPLEYLGFRIDPERHLETILTATNYYPGVIQYFGYTLLEKFTDRCINSGSDEITPPFPVDDSLLGSVIASQELTEAATHTLRLSLSLDKYFMLGQCIAYLYYSGGGEISGAFRGFSVSEIIEADSELTQCMAGESYEAYDAMLREMSDMGILSRLSNGSYRFRRQSFVKSIWPDEDSVLRTGE